MKLNSLYIILTISIFLLLGCRKEDEFLGAKTNIALTVPQTLEDFQYLLNNEGLFNRNDPALGALTGEDYYIDDKSYPLRTTNERNAYIFASSIYAASGDYSDWSVPYNAIYVANTVLDGLNKIQPDSARNRLIGQALFYRSWQFYNLLQTFALPYDSVSASTDLGIPIRTSSDFNLQVPRSTVKDCYSQIINDLKLCIGYLPQTTASPTQPTSIASKAFLARIYLAIGKYHLAGLYSDSVLLKDNSLLDFNDINPSTLHISTSFVPEDLFHNTLKSYTFVYYSTYSNIDTVLYSLYNDLDLRKSIYFVKRTTGNMTFKGSYNKNNYSYSGLAKDEMFLIRAECEAREGDIPGAINDLNTLLTKRWKKGSFVPYNASAMSVDSALSVILLERRKELIWRGLRWTDLRRLNKESKFQTTLRRTVDGTSYSLPPNSPKYALPIPPNEVTLNNIQQNNR